jgi:hypothetical protein
MFEESGEPPRVRKVVGELPEAIPFLAVDEIHPRGDLAEPMRVEDVRSRFHRNVLNVLDSLQQVAYAFVMSITVIEHYNNGDLAERFRGSRHRSLVSRCP